MKKYLIIIFSLLLTTNYIYAKIMNSNIAEDYFKQAIKEDIEGNYYEAIKNYDKAISLNPYAGTLYNNRAIAKYNAAPYVIEQSHCFLSICFIVDKRYCNDVISDLDKAIELKYNFAEAFYNRGLIKAYTGKPLEAIKDFDKAIKLNPKYDKAFAERSYQERKLSKNPLTTFYYSIILFRNINKSALNDINKAIELSPNNAYYYVKKSVVCKSEGEHDKEIQFLNKAIELEPNNGELYILRAQSKESLRYHEENIMADFNKAIEIDKNNVYFYTKREEYKKRIGDTEGAKKDHDIIVKDLQADENYRIYENISKKIKPEVFSRVDKI